LAVDAGRLGIAADDDGDVELKASIDEGDLGAAAEICAGRSGVPAARQGLGPGLRRLDRRTGQLPFAAVLAGLNHRACVAQVDDAA